MIDFQGVQCDLPKLEWCFSFLTALTTRVLASELQAHFTTDSNRQTPRWIAVGLDLSHCELTTSQFVKLHEVMRAYAEFEPPQAESSGCQQVFFVITSLNLSWNEFQSHRDYEIVTDIMLLQSSRVAVRHLNLTNTFYAKTPIAHVTAFQWFIQRVLRDDASSLEELSLGGECHVSDAHVAAVYSALRYSTKLKALRIKQNPESTSKEDVSCNFQAMWSWLALAVMHSSSVSTLMSLAFPYFAITEEVVDCFQKTLESEQPAMIALTAESPEMEAIVKRDSEARIHPAGKTFVSIKRGSKLRLWPKTQASVLMLSQYAIDRPLEVVLTLSKWTCVIIPGCGFGWVMNAALVVHEERQMSSRRIPLRAFMWIAPKTYTVAHIPAVRSLVCLIGEGLKALYLAKTQFTTDDMATIVAHCPLLQHLEVPRHNLLSLEFLRKHSSIRLRTLNVQFFVNGPAIDAYSPWSLVADLVAFLKSPASQRLWHLAFEYKWDGMMVTRLLTAVEKHPTLETVDIFHVSNENGDVYERQATSPGQSPAMRQAVKLAFLSVIRHQLETTSIALHRLDAVLVAAIFLFAAEPTQKQINHIHRRAYTRGF
ncbi:hypothetical protein Poli38472_011110 [Pythium oligandrum]|uniref:Uncharacterized protein n=1 Tax=Pythium oligandrum TaxID=41045 RepID=A0A8K1CRN5_PYTOL|nr:hypothetical protein Poli38472_011110 [Pythium oligandrum]|eukprot:TMW67490.1 hypothetical protein Poli38472_011110 [Pythium oligandrum]